MYIIYYIYIYTHTPPTFCLFIHKFMVFSVAFICSLLGKGCYKHNVQQAFVKDEHKVSVLWVGYIPSNRTAGSYGN